MVHLSPEAQRGEGTSLDDRSDVYALGGILYYLLSAHSPAEDAIGAAFAGGPVAMAYSRFDDQTRDDAHGEYLDSIAAFAVNGGQ